MAFAFVAASHFLVQPTSPSSNRLKCCGGKVNVNSAVLTMTHGVEDTFGAKLSQDGRVLTQNFVIRSYEIGPDGKSSLGLLMERLQETSMQHGKKLGLYSGGIGSTPEMVKRDLVWVARSVQMKVDEYPSWNDVVQVDTWVVSRDSGLFRDWVFRDYKTKEVLAQASSLQVMMNAKTRRLAKFIPEINDEIKHYCTYADPSITTAKLRGLDVNSNTFVERGLTPRWTDLDVNEHVGYVKYFDWVIQSIPLSVMKSYELVSIVLDYRRECRINDMLQSLRSAAKTFGQESNDKAKIEFDHSLRLEDGLEILRAKTIWRPRAEQSS